MLVWKFGSKAKLWLSGSIRNLAEFILVRNLKVAQSLRCVGRVRACRKILGSWKPRGKSTSKYFRSKGSLLGHFSRRVGHTLRNFLCIIGNSSGTFSGTKGYLLVHSVGRRKKFGISLGILSDCQGIFWRDFV